MMGAVEEGAGPKSVLLVVVVGAVAVYRPARRMSDSRATPPPVGVAPDSEERARRRAAKARGAYDPSGVMCIYQAPPVEEPSAAPEDDEETERNCSAETTQNEVVGACNDGGRSGAGVRAVAEHRQRSNRSERTCSNHARSNRQNVATCW